MVTLTQHYVNHSSTCQLSTHHWPNHGPPPPNTAKKEKKRRKKKPPCWTIPRTTVPSCSAVLPTNVDSSSLCSEAGDLVSIRVVNTFIIRLAEGHSWGWTEASGSILLQLVAAGQQQTQVGGRGVHGTRDVLRVVLHSNVVRVICSIQSLQSSYHLSTCSIQSLQSSYHLYTCSIQSLQSSYHLSTNSLNSFYTMVRHSTPSRHISSAWWYAIVYHNLNIHFGKKGCYLKTA